MPKSPSPTDILRQDQEAAQRLATGVGKQRTLEVLKKAQLGLERRLRTAEGLGGPGQASFTATQLRSTLAQVRAVLTPLQNDMKGVVLDQGKKAAEQSATAASRYLSSAEKHFKGSTARLPLDQARLVDRAVAGTESSVLSRLLGGQHEGKKTGILQRYGHNVVQHFEDVLQQRLIQKTPWDEVKQQLIEGSPFLQQAPAHWAERIVRTETMNQAGRATQATIDESQKTLGDMCKIISSTFDARTGADSYAVHGQIRRPSESFESWFGSFMHPPDRPNDRGIVVPHRISWPIPAELKPKGAGATASRWAAEGRKGGMPSMPLQTTIPLDQFGKEQSPAQQQTPADENPGSHQQPDQRPAERPVQVQVPGVLQRMPERPAPTVIEPAVELPARLTRQDYTDAGISVHSTSYGVEEIDNAHTEFQSTMGTALSPAIVKSLIGLEGPAAEGGSYTVFAAREKVSIRFKSPGADILRDYHREEGELVVHHSLFEIETRFKGGGFGKRALRSQVEQYDKLGVKRIDTEAAWDGQYVWPHMGFTSSNPAQFGRIKLEYSRYLKRVYGLAEEHAVQQASEITSMHDLAEAVQPEGVDGDPHAPYSQHKNQSGKRFLFDRGNVTGGEMIELVVHRGAPEETTLRDYLGMPARPTKP